MEPEVRYWLNGRRQSKIYRVNNQPHRIDGPAVTRWHEDGNKESEIYLVNGVWHRIDGPARTWWDKNGNKQSEEYRINGEYYTKEEFEASWEYQFYLFDLEVADNF